MKKNITGRYDAWGNPILPRNLMIAYYQTDKKSLNIIQNNMPHSYVVMPTVEIHINPQNPSLLRIYRIYPGGVLTSESCTSEHALQALRRAYKGFAGWKGHTTKGGYCIVRREGSVIKDPTRKFAFNPYE